MKYVYVLLTLCMFSSNLLSQQLPMKLIKDGNTYKIIAERADASGPIRVSGKVKNNDQYTWEGTGSILFKEYQSLNKLGANENRIDLQGYYFSNDSGISYLAYDYQLIIENENIYFRNGEEGKFPEIAGSINTDQATHSTTITIHHKKSYERNYEISEGHKIEQNDGKRSNVFHAPFNGEYKTTINIAPSEMKIKSHFKITDSPYTFNIPGSFKKFNIKECKNNFNLGQREYRDNAGRIIRVTPPQYHYTDKCLRSWMIQEILIDQEYELEGDFNRI